MSNIIIKASADRIKAEVTYKNKMRIISWVRTDKGCDKNIVILGDGKFPEELLDLSFIKPIEMMDALNKPN